VQHAIIVDVEASTAVRPAEVTPRQENDRAHDELDLWPERLIADAGYGSAEMLNWLVNDRGIEPHIPVFDKSKRADDTFSREDFAYDHESDTYRCPGGKTLRRYRREFMVPRIGVMKDNSLRYRASKHDCEPCPLKPRCCPNAPARRVPRSIYEGARDLARVAARHHQRHVVFCGDRVEDAGESVLLAPDFDVGVGVRPQGLPVELGCRFQRASTPL
jgi:hypothetical protein